jgi:hypothetical protein
MTEAVGVEVAAILIEGAERQQPGLGEIGPAAEILSRHIHQPALDQSRKNRRDLRLPATRTGGPGREANAGGERGENPEGLG